MLSFQAKLVQNNSLTVVVDNTPYTVDSSHPNWAKLRGAVKDNDATLFLSLVDIPKAVQKVIDDSQFSGKVEVVDGSVLYNGEVIHNTVTQRMLELVRGGFDIEPMIKFLENLMQNPSKHSVDQLYNFLQHKGLPITEDGCVIGYKSVRDNYLDKYSGTISNKPGSVVKVPRNTVDDRPEHHCSHGLHIGAWEYAGVGGWYNSTGDKVLLVKFNPKDVVSVPTDHSFTKLRVCEYTVLDEVKGTNLLNRPVYSGLGVQDEGYEDDEYDYDDEYDCDYNEYYCVEDLDVNDEIKFGYDGQTRYAEVVGCNWTKGVTLCRLVAPESDAGAYRTFSNDKMVNIEVTN